MGGCYRSDCSRPERTTQQIRESTMKSSISRAFNQFKKTGDVSELVKAQKAFFDDKSSGFIAEIAKRSGISNVGDIPKEFPETEYEVKFDIQLQKGSGSEPGLVDILNSFDFPAVSTARFLKDPVNLVTEGVNNFYGSSLDEKLVVIEKAGGLYLKEKGPVQPISYGIPFEHVVMKRAEKRWKADFSEVEAKIKEVAVREGAEYRGKIRKEKGDAFVLDTNDGRIYSFTITRAHLIKSGDIKESETQRQLELEYAGYIPGFNGFKKNSEEQIVQGIVDLAKYTGVMYNNAPIKKGWRMDLATTSQRKYDFVFGKSTGELEGQKPLQMSLQLAREPVAVRVR